MLKSGTLVLFLFYFLNATGQQLSDSIHYSLPQVEIISIPEQERLRSVSSETNISAEELRKHPGSSMVSAINTSAGVRMEERSPGSYRLSVRGSLLRSPFGVRNIKIYLNGFPFTDAGGNTYLNILDPEIINNIKILKGPESSLFGANTGGAILINSVKSTDDSVPVNIKFSYGSYGMMHENAVIQKQWKKYSLSIGQGTLVSNGYRSQSFIQRHFLQVNQNLNYANNKSLKVFIMFSDLHYETPGGLTRAEFEADPRSSRPATKSFPGTAEQKTGVFNKTGFAGVTHDAFLYKNLRHIISVFGSHTNFENPFITNYEVRSESTYGLRTYLDLASENSKKIIYRCNAGVEWQHSVSDISNYWNASGVKDTLQTSDDLKAKQYFFFARFLTDLQKKVLVEASASINFFGYSYRNNYPFSESNFKQNKFKPQLMPRVAASYKFNEMFAWRLSVSKGYSPPTLAEIRSSDNVVNSNIQAESGWNYETGIRFNDPNKRIWIDINAFYFSLRNTIVRRVNAEDAEYFVNAGQTSQPGMEVQTGILAIKKDDKGIIRSLFLNSSLSYSYFRFVNYQVTDNIYSGNRLTGVPKWVVSGAVTIVFPAQVELFIRYYYSSKIPLNDANTEYAKEYQLVQAKVNWHKQFKVIRLLLSCGIDNLLDQRYSLGNDLNASGGRYYNTAPGRNYYAAVGIGF